MANTYHVGEQTRQNILEESRKLFYENGYAQTTYNDISKAANVNRALIPYHFKSKQVLGREIYYQIIDEIYDLIDNILDTSQFDSDFTNVLYMVICNRTCADNSHFSRFVAELKADPTTELFIFENEKIWLTGLGNKFTTLNEAELTALTKMHTGIKKESIELLCNPKEEVTPDQISNIHLRMLMQYAGYSSKKINELLDAAYEVANLLTVEIGNGFSINLRYN